MTHAISPETQTQLLQWRAKVAEGTFTLDDCRAAMKVLRANRLSAATASAKALKGSKPKKPAANADALLDELEGL